jgi:signal transduction histidine kinase
LDSELTYLINGINEALRKSRQIISNLRPNILDDIGIIIAMKKALKDFQDTENIETTFLYSEGIDVSTRIGIAFFRILQEAIHNTRKYAQATKVDVSMILEDNANLSLAIQDNGLGFDAHENMRCARNSGMGLLIMRERAEDLGGEFEVDSKIGKGCRIVARAPLEGR